jgi:hypothetical protein
VNALRRLLAHASPARLTGRNLGDHLGDDPLSTTLNRAEEGLPNWAFTDGAGCPETFAQFTPRRSLVRSQYRPRAGSCWSVAFGYLPAGRDFFPGAEPRGPAIGGRGRCSTLPAVATRCRTVPFADAASDGQDPERRGRCSRVLTGWRAPALTISAMSDSPPMMPNSA